MSLILTDVKKSFGEDDRIVEVLSSASFRMEGGQSLAITGPSGSGKSTLLHIIGTLDSPSEGKVEINGNDPFALPEPQLARFRNQAVGFVFQDHHLLPQYSVLENVLLPTLAFRDNDGGKESRAIELIDRVGLTNRMAHLPGQLSGGERQRVAVARALINGPSLLLCDEPTGNLDGATAASVASLFFELHQEAQNMIIVVTHNLDLARQFDRRLELQEGTCVEA